MCTTAGGNTQPRWQLTTAGDAVVTALVRIRVQTADKNIELIHK